MRILAAWLVGMPGRSRSHLLPHLGGVLERLPRLRIAFAHAAAPSGTSDGSSNGFARRPDLVGFDTPPPSVHLKRIYVDSLVPTRAALLLVLELSAPSGWRWAATTVSAWRTPAGRLIRFMSFTPERCASTGPLRPALDGRRRRHASSS